MPEKKKASLFRKVVMGFIVFSFLLIAYPALLIILAKGPSALLQKYGSHQPLSPQAVGVIFGALPSMTIILGFFAMVLLAVFWDLAKAFVVLCYRMVVPKENGEQ